MARISGLALVAVTAACAGSEPAPIGSYTQPTDDPWSDTAEEDSPCDEPGVVCRWLGVPETWGHSGEGTDRGTGWDTATYLFFPQDITFADDGTAYYPDYNNHRIRQVSADGIVTTISGTGLLGDGPNNLGSVVDCWEGCVAADSNWNHPTGIAIDPGDSARLYVAAWENSRINRLDLVEGTMTWVAGTGGRFYGDGVDPATAALPVEERTYELSRAILDLPSSVAFGPDGTLYFSDQSNHMVRKISPGSDRVEIAAGSIVLDVDPVTGVQLPGPGSVVHRQPGYEGNGGDALVAKLHGHDWSHANPGGRIVVDGHRLLIADTGNGVMRSVDLDTGIIDLFAGKYVSLGMETRFDAITGEVYEADAGSVSGYSGDGGDALEAVFNTPHDLAVGIDGEVYVADTRNHCVRVIRDGIVATFAGVCDPDFTGSGYSGDGGVYSGDGGPATEAQFGDILGVEVDAQGDVYIADTYNHVIRRVRPLR